MSINLYDMSIPLFSRGLTLLGNLIDKAIAHAEENKIPVDEILDWKLVDDMLPFKYQIQIATNTSKLTLARVLKTEGLPIWDDKETTLAQLKARVTQASELLKSVTSADFEGKKDVETILPSSKGDRTFTGLTYLQFYAVPNFYFHVVTAYDILRAKGIQVGKADYLLVPKTA